jgi:hypothetical protein
MMLSALAAAATVLALMGTPATPEPFAPPPERPAQPPRPAPLIDPTSVSFFPDQGRLELKGAHLAGLKVAWRSGAKSGDDTCVDPKPAPDGHAAGEQCAFGVPRDLPGDVTFSVAGAEASRLAPARVVVDRVLPASVAVDLSNGVGRIPLPHPEAIAAVDCAPARCELGESSIAVRSAPGTAGNLTLRLKLAPHYLVARGDTTDTAAARTVSVLHCPAAMVSGPPLRHPSGSVIIVRLDERCGRDARDLRWSVNARAADVQRVEHLGDGVYVQLGVAEVGEAQVTVLAVRPEPDDTTIAVVHADTQPAPHPRATLELPGVGKIAFLPTNRDALLRLGPAPDHARFVPLPVEGAYRVTAAPATGGPARVRGEESAGGVVALRFGYRVDSLPTAFAATDLAVLSEPLERPIREASVPAPIGASVQGATPLVELICADRAGHAVRIAPGARASIPFAQRDSCRLVIHRERLTPEEGTQDINVEVNVTKVDDAPRPDAHVTERMVLRPGAEPRIFWIHGVHAPFDRLTVRVAHVVDEAHDVGGSDLHVEVPAAQWAVVVGEGHLRFYATAAIPTGLFRITAPSDVLTLNFGALSRLTWLDRDGQEGLLGLELGALGIGLAATPGFPRTLAVLTGLGVSIPIGNRGEKSEAAVNLHAWIAYELRQDFKYYPDPVNAPNTFTIPSHWSFLFGPSITIGNVGANL